VSPSVTATVLRRGSTTQKLVQPLAIQTSILSLISSTVLDGERTSMTRLGAPGRYGSGMSERSSPDETKIRLPGFLAGAPERKLHIQKASSFGQRQEDSEEKLLRACMRLLTWRHCES
jgi:hypothetical protein